MPLSLRLAFDRAGMAVDLPDGFNYTVLEAKSAASLPNPTLAIEQALDAAGLSALAAGRKSAAISVCDITRPAPNRVTLPPVLRRLEAAGIARENIVILIATGLHRPATSDEISEIVGQEIARDYRVENHDARTLSDHKFLGNTASGTPAWVDRRFVDAELRMSLGFIEPHLMAGFSGGRKLVVPGLAAQETIKVIHSPRFMREPRAVEGSIEDNPLHRELTELARMAGHEFILDVSLSRDRGIAGVFAGNPVTAHREGVGFVSQALLQELPAQVDAVITTAAGYPLDLTYYQCIKGITAASHIVKPGGRILVAGACTEGCGGPEFTRLIEENSNPSDFLKSLEGKDVTVDQWQLEKLALVALRANIHYFVPGLAPELRAKLWGAAYGDWATAVKEFVSDLPRNSTVVVIPEGPYVLAKALAAAA